MTTVPTTPHRHDRHTSPFGTPITGTPADQAWTLEGRTTRRHPALANVLAPEVTR